MWFLLISRKFYDPFPFHHLSFQVIQLQSFLHLSQLTKDSTLRKAWEWSKMARLLLDASKMRVASHPSVMLFPEVFLTSQLSCKEHARNGGQRQCRDGNSMEIFLELRWPHQPLPLWICNNWACDHRAVLSPVVHAAAWCMTFACRSWSLSTFVYTDVCHVPEFSTIFFFFCQSHLTGDHSEVIGFGKWYRDRLDWLHL